LIAGTKVGESSGCRKCFSCWWCPSWQNSACVFR